MRTALPELLAPAGSLSALAAVIEAGADSVYIAGKRFGMRQHAKWLNLDEPGMAAAIESAHDHGKRIYVTVNNLLTDLELQELDSLLGLLEAWEPDALIIQDLGLLHKLRRRDIRWELHASCMMNVNSLASAQGLGELGVSRIIASRDISLGDAARLQRESGVAFEYFLHGDMCIAQSGQCTVSGIMAGESSSRGRCLKPCRWQWELIGAEGGVVPDGSGLLMARKDLCLLEHIPALAQSGIAALKIEGRARTPEYLARIVWAYRRALDAYAVDPEGYTTDLGLLDDLKTNRLRDFSTCLTFGDPGRQGVGQDGIREPRVFSVVIEQPPLKEDAPVAFNAVPIESKPELVVQCGCVESAEAALAAGADGICVGGEQWRQGGPVLTRADIGAISRYVTRGGARLYCAAPRISETDELTDGALPGNVVDVFEAYYVHTLGQLRTARGRGLRVIADLGLNAFNTDAFELLDSLGAIRCVTSLELSLPQVARMAPSLLGQMELVIHGPVVGMICEHCFVKAACGCNVESRANGRPPCTPAMALRDVAGQKHPVLTDTHCRNHILLPRQLCALPVFSELLALRPVAVRIDGRHETPRVLGEIVDVYKTAIDHQVEGLRPLTDGMQRLLRCTRNGLSLCALGLSVADVAAPGDGLPTDEWVQPPARPAGKPVPQMLSGTRCPQFHSDR